MRTRLVFRPVFANRSAMAYALCYMVHTWEMSALRGWVVAFLAYTAARGGGGATLVAPTAVASALGLVGVWASVAGNEASRRIGRRRFINIVMLLTMAIAPLVGFTSALPYPVAVVLVVIYAAFIWTDSSSLTAGASGTALRGQRGGDAGHSFHPRVRGGASWGRWCSASCSTLPAARASSGGGWLSRMLPLSSRSGRRPRDPKAGGAGRRQEDRPLSMSRLASPGASNGSPDSGRPT
jgi:hypothetical protein